MKLAVPILFCALAVVGQLNISSPFYVAGTLKPSGGATPPSTLVTNLVSFWYLDETSGTRNDEVGANDLSENGSPLPPGVTGLFTNAVDLENGNSDYLSIADNASLSGLSNITVSCWFQCESVPNNAQIIGKWNTTGNAREWFLRLTTNSTNVRVDWLVSTNGNSTAYTATMNSGVSLANFVGPWWHLGVTSATNTASVTMWLRSTNGTTVFTNIATSADIPDKGSAFQIGATASSPTYFDGLIDDVGIWANVARSSNDILNIFTYGTNGISYPWTGQP